MLPQSLWLLCPQIKKQTEEEKVNTLKEQALSLTQHIESLKSSIQVSVSLLHYLNVNYISSYI